jgi:putative PIN family toxin of toxin-antitoxin system
MSYRIVADTNILISATFWGGQPERIIGLVRTGEVTLLTTHEMIAELKAVLSYPKFERYFQGIGRSIDDVIKAYQQMTEMVIPANLPKCQPP